MPKSQISALVDEAEKDKDCLTALEKIIDTEKTFSKLKDKQINKALLKVEKAGTRWWRSSRFPMSTQISSVIIMWRASTFFGNTWLSTTQS